MTQINLDILGRRPHVKRQGGQSALSVYNCKFKKLCLIKLYWSYFDDMHIEEILCTESSNL